MHEPWPWTIPSMVFERSKSNSSCFRYNRTYIFSFDSIKIHEREQTCGETIVDDGRQHNQHNDYEITFSHWIRWWAHNFWPPSVNNFVKSWLDSVMVCLCLTVNTVRCDGAWKVCAWKAAVERWKASPNWLIPCIEPIIIICACVCTRNARVYRVFRAFRWRSCCTNGLDSRPYKLSAVVSKLKSTCFFLLFVVPFTLITTRARLSRPTVDNN